jgi:pilus assembly protein Flp/PilA
MLKVIKRVREDEEGASAVEYGLLVAAIAAIVILLVFAIGGWVKGAFDQTCDAFETAEAEGGPPNTGPVSDCPDS